MTSEQISVLQCALQLKAALDTRTAAQFLRGRQVPVTIAAMVLARRSGDRVAGVPPDVPGSGGTGRRGLSRG